MKQLTADTVVAEQIQYNDHMDSVGDFTLIKQENKACVRKQWYSRILAMC
jgi:hypothetical protein